MNRIPLSHTIRFAMTLGILCGCQKQSPSDALVRTAQESAPQAAAPASTDTTPLEANPVPSELVIEPDVGVGALRFGMNFEQMTEILGIPERTQGKAYEYMSKGMAVMGSRDTTVAVLLFGGRCEKDEPLVEICQYETSKGIRMGSTEAKIAAAYGSPSARRNLPGDGGDLVLLDYEQPRATFTLQDGKLVHMLFKKPAD